MDGQIEKWVAAWLLVVGQKYDQIERNMERQIELLKDRQKYELRKVTNLKGQQMYGNMERNIKKFKYLHFYYNFDSAYSAEKI